MLNLATRLKLLTTAVFSLVVVLAACSGNNPVVPSASNPVQSQTGSLATGSTNGQALVIKNQGMLLPEPVTIVGDVTTGFLRKIALGVNSGW